MLGGELLFINGDGVSIEKVGGAIEMYDAGFGKSGLDLVARFSNGVELVGDGSGITKSQILVMKFGARTSLMIDIRSV